MKTKDDIYEFFDTIQPYMQKIMKDLDKNEMVQMAIAPGQEGWAILYEVHKGEEYQHHVKIQPDGTAVDWHVMNPRVAS